MCQFYQSSVHVNTLMIGFLPLHSYDPELFSGLFFKGIPGMTVNVFANGEMAFLGSYAAFVSTHFSSLIMC